MSERTSDAREAEERKSRDTVDRRQALKVLGASLFAGLFGDKAKAALLPFGEEAEATPEDSEWIYGEMNELYNFVNEQHGSFRENLKECFASEELDGWVDYIEKQINLYVYIRVKDKAEERASLQILAQEGRELRRFVLQRLNKASDFPVKYLDQESFIEGFNLALSSLFQAAAAKFTKAGYEHK